MNTWTYPLDVPAVLAVFGRPSILGVSGSSEQVLPNQLRAGREVAAALLPTQLHHGDCVQWDHKMALIADEYGIDTWSHPPTNPRKRAFHDSTVKLRPKPYMVRNGDIANDTDGLVAGPDEDDEIVRSGTWATIRRARAAGRPVLILGPTRVWVELSEQPSLEVLA